MIIGYWDPWGVYVNPYATQKPPVNLSKNSSCPSGRGLADLDLWSLPLEID